MPNPSPGILTRNRRRPRGGRRFVLVDALNACRTRFRQSFATGRMRRIPDRAGRRRQRKTVRFPSVSSPNPHGSRLVERESSGPDRIQRKIGPVRGRDPAVFALAASSAGSADCPSPSIPTTTPEERGYRHGTRANTQPSEYFVARRRSRMGLNGRGIRCPGSTGWRRVSQRRSRIVGERRNDRLVKSPFSSREIFNPFFFS